jgi:sugar/nucleoside kinase (ribokinase family)
MAAESVLTVGGSAAITASGLAQLGVRTAFTGVVGDDEFGRFVMTELAERDIDTTGCVIDPKRATGVTVVLSRGDDRASVTSPGCTFSLTASQASGAIGASSLRHVHTSMYFYFPELGRDLASVFEQARAGGATTSLDPHADPSGTWDTGIRNVLRFVDVFLPNEEEACGIAGLDSVEAAAGALAAMGPGIVAVKRGSRGAVACSGDTVVQVPAPDMGADQVVDATGAGDSFNAGFLAGHLEGWELKRCLELAVACGSLSTRAIGGVDAQPSRAEAFELIEAARSAD